MLSIARRGTFRNPRVRAGVQSYLDIQMASCLYKASPELRIVANTKHPFPVSRKFSFLHCTVQLVFIILDRNLAAKILDESGSEFTSLKFSFEFEKMGILVSIPWWRNMRTFQEAIVVRFL